MSISWQSFSSTSSTTILLDVILNTSCTYKLNVPLKSLKLYPYHLLKGTISYKLASAYIYARGGGDTQNNRHTFQGLKK